MLSCLLLFLLTITVSHHGCMSQQDNLTVCQEYPSSYTFPVIHLVHDIDSTYNVMYFNVTNSSTECQVVARYFATCQHPYLLTDSNIGGDVATVNSTDYFVYTFYFLNMTTILFTFPTETVVDYIRLYYYLNKGHDAAFVTMEFFEVPPYYLLEHGRITGDDIVFIKSVTLNSRGLSNILIPFQSTTVRKLLVKFTEHNWLLFFAISEVEFYNYNNPCHPGQSMYTTSEPLSTTVTVDKSTSYFPVAYIAMVAIVVTILTCFILIVIVIVVVIYKKVILKDLDYETSHIKLSSLTEQGKDSSPVQTTQNKQDETVGDFDPFYECLDTPRPVPLQGRQKRQNIGIGNYYIDAPIISSSQQTTPDKSTPADMSQRIYAVVDRTKKKKKHKIKPEKEDSPLDRDEDLPPPIPERTTEIHYAALQKKPKYKKQHTTSIAEDTVAPPMPPP